ncbi:hypothetical protein BC829DRAFT_104608 [Chytridium lagenaria]|nr:hypothetical protein BC829DRAFT_104608 [Chytridium lagenaria]
MTEVNPISVPGDADAGQVSMPPKRFHMFISYRVKTDGHTAERLCDKLQSCSILNEQKDFRLRCFLDKQNLTGGQNYKTQFMDGLNSSCLFLPVISLAVLAGMTGLTEDVEDNVVLEWETALEMHSQGQIAIFPILVGDVETTEKGYLLQEVRLLLDCKRHSGYPYKRINIALYRASGHQ